VRMVPDTKPVERLSEHRVDLLHNDSRIEASGSC